MFRQGLILVMVPLVFGTLLIVLLNQLWKSTEQVVLQEQRQSNFIQSMNVVFNSWAELSKDLLASAFMTDATSDYEKKSRQVLPTLRRELHALSKANDGQAERWTSVERLKKLLEDEAELFSSMKQSIPTGEDSGMLAHLNRLPKLLSRTFQIRGQVKKLLSDEMQRLVSFHRKRNSQERT